MVYDYKKERKIKKQMKIIWKIILCILNWPFYILNFKNLNKYVSDKKDSIGDQQNNIKEISENVLQVKIEEIENIIQKNNTDIAKELENKINLIQSNYQNNIDNMAKNIDTSFKNNKDLIIGNVDNNQKLIEKNSQLNSSKIKEIISEKINNWENKNNKEFEKIQEVVKDTKKITNDVKMIFENNKNRGNLGEILLESHFENIFGKEYLKNDQIWEKQYKLSNDTRPDFIIKYPTLNKIIPIDCKFPWNNIKNIMEKDDLLPNELKLAKQDIKKMINDIDNKYIKPKETTDFAIMYIPSESIFNFILSEMNDIFLYAQSKKVCICSPTNILAIITTFKFATQETRLNDNAQELVGIIKKIMKEINMFSTRWTKHVKKLEEVMTTVKQLEITYKKIDKQNIILENHNKGKETLGISISSIKKPLSKQEEAVI